MFKQKLASSALVVCAISLLIAGAAKADSVFPFDSTTGTGPWEMTSTASTDSGLVVSFDTPIQFSTLTTLSVSFVDHSGGADAGSPRIELYDFDNSDYFTVYLGTAPNFSDSDPAAFTTNFSGTNLNNASNNSTYQLGNTYVTLASLQAAYGTDSIYAVYLFLDGGYAANGTQDLTLNSLNINGTVYSHNEFSFDTPLPAAWPLFASGAGVLGYFGLRRRQRKAAA